MSQKVGKYSENDRDLLKETGTKVNGLLLAKTWNHGSNQVSDVSDIVPQIK